MGQQPEPGAGMWPRRTKSTGTAGLALPRHNVALPLGSAKERGRDSAVPFPASVWQQQERKEINRGVLSPLPTQRATAWASPRLRWC